MILGSGEQYTFAGTTQFSTMQRLPLLMISRTGQQRDRRKISSASAQYVLRDLTAITIWMITAIGKLFRTTDASGLRSVAAGWAPNLFGHWVWIAPWGWTWIGDEPWGFAPFHYGRWAFVGGYWGWLPPTRCASSLCTGTCWFVGGSGFGVTVGFGGGVREYLGFRWARAMWVLGYRCSPRYIQNVNVTNTRVVTVTQVTNVYNNYTVNRTVNVNEYTYARNVSAVTVVDRETFVNARPVANATLRVTPEQFEKARVVEAAPLAPTRNSYVASTAKPVSASQRPAKSFSRSQSGG